ncbi:DUF3750 domain-containing protein [Jannaschia aquimarina]|uniref:DUF3750 domain-containing protein n=1 Tax=Jannaschia aquimarina TaxID=935700 RepID=A0A0D1DA82_9RHOB|nr:DUF3750 domain-containing protein [Jannaschia aquimarina]KIT16793.1 hypothetical protein jaqu_15810 [Jannaschia aquimarina]SNS52239.1 Protein of unknown function [Jannaschia aquimarina]
MLRFLRRTMLALILMFLVPLLAASGWWSVQDRPASWRQADWGASGLLPAAAQIPEARIHVMAARTGGAKGAVSVHSWIVWKTAQGPWRRYDVVGWGTPVRRDAYAPDARWYSNAPTIIGTVSGDRAEALIPRLQAAVDDYPNGRGSYRMFPGPNSNTFVEHLLRQVPELGVTLPPHAVGRAWLGEGLNWTRDAGGDMHVSAWGLAGLSAGPRTGVELHLLGQTLGIDILRPALKLPGIGRVGV